MEFNLNNKQFKATYNTDNGEVNQDTLFYYHQEGRIVWADYLGGEIKKGHLIGMFTDTSTLEFVYHHINILGEILTGKCKSTLSIVDGKLALNEEWQWTCRDNSQGKSILKEA